MNDRFLRSLKEDLELGAKNWYTPPVPVYLFISKAEVMPAWLPFPFFGLKRHHSKTVFPTMIGKLGLIPLL